MMSRMEKEKMLVQTHFYYASAQRIMSCSSVLACIRLCVHPCVRPETLLTRYLAEYLTHFHRTYVKNVCALFLTALIFLMRFFNALINTLI